MENLPTIPMAAAVALVFLAIVARGVYNRRHHKGGCGCGCDSCPNSGACHPKS